MEQLPRALKIIHTADWHLGKRLHGHDLSEDHRLFFDWLITTIKLEEVGLLLISGDIFDLANPSSEARKLYYEVLVRLRELGCKVILTGGNHDSPSVLNASQTLLRAMDIHVVGGRTDEICDMVIPVYGPDGDPLMAVAAVPFLRDADLRQMVRGEGHNDREEAVCEGIRQTFADLTDHCRLVHGDLPIIALGHLYTHGATSSDSEREIQVGNLAGFESAGFGGHFSYVALGHIHRPQEVGDTGHIFYSGSPVPLSFTEKDDSKRVILITLNNAKLTHESLAIPKFRQLRKVTGNLDQVKSDLQSLDVGTMPLKTLLELEVVEQKPDPAKVVELEELSSNFNHPQATIVKHRIRFTEQTSGTAALYDTTQHLADLRPMDVFHRRLEHEGIDGEQRKMLSEAFSEILESLDFEEK